MKILFVLLFATSVFAQHSEQPEPIETEERGNYIVFEIEDTKNNKKFTLERSPYLDHFLRFVHKKNERLQKADSKLARSLDSEFSSLFIKALYEWQTKEGSCDKVYQLRLKGEEQSVCKKDDQKTQVLKSFIEMLEKKF